MKIYHVTTSTTKNGKIVMPAGDYVRHADAKAIEEERDRLQADLAEARKVLADWLTFAADVRASDFAGLEWLNTLRSKSSTLTNKEP